MSVRPLVRRFRFALLGAAFALLLIAGSGSIAPVALAATFTVNDNGDADNGSCGSPCTLRDAITAVNAAGAGPHTIEFNISAGPGGSVTISPTTPLPRIVRPVTIKGDSQPGTDPLPRVTLDGSTNSFDGLIFNAGADASVVRGLVITSFNDAISINGANKLLIGGTTAAARNVISGDNTGVYVVGDEATIQGNYIGTDKTGTGSLGNYFGVYVAGANKTLIGGTAAGARNVISKNSYAVFITSGDATTIQGNYIGTDKDGTNSLGNVNGVLIAEGTRTLIGGTTAAARNVISNSSNTGLYVGGDQTTIQGNYIGTDKDGTNSLGNNIGVLIAGATRTLIGGTTAAARNVISNNGNGVWVNVGDATTIQGNYVGTDKDGIVGLGNSYGVFVDGATNTLIGGTTDGQGNLIARNGLAGIALTSGVDAQIRRNVYGGNSVQAIDLDNDFAVTCTGAASNNGIHCPLLSAAPDGATSLVSGTVDSGGGCPDASCTIEVYRAVDSGDDSNHGEGVALLGSTSSVSGHNWSLPTLPFCNGDKLSATATNTSNGTSSEFALNVTASGPSPSGAPSKPVRVAATPGNSKATLSFAPTCQGGSPVLDYTVTAYLKGQPVGTITTTQTSGVIFPGLKNGQTYTFTVRARNSSGSSAESAPSNPVTLGPDLTLVDGVFLDSQGQPLAGFGGDNVYDTKSKGAGGSNVGSGDGPAVTPGGTLSLPFRLENDGRLADRIKFRSATSSRTLAGISITVLGLKLNDGTDKVEPGAHRDGTIQVQVGPNAGLGKYVVRLQLQPNGTSATGQADSVTVKFVVKAAGP